MDFLKNVMVNSEMNLIDVMKQIDDSALQFAVVVNENKNILGTITDGDIRRAIIKYKNTNINIKKVMNPNPITSKSEKHRIDYEEIMNEKDLKQLPIIDENNRLVDVIFKDKKLEKDNYVVLMVGGMGTRLRPLTYDTPKPMLKVGNKPILEKIINQFKENGFNNFLLMVNYKKEVIKDYFGDGKKFGITITYIEEEKKMGTAGALSLISNVLDKPFFVMNGDIISDVEFSKVLEFHLESSSDATMCVREYEYQIPFGVIQHNGEKIVSIDEKPKYKQYVNSGIYILNPNVLKYVPHNEFFDMTTLFERVISAGNKGVIFPIEECWIDIGRLDDYEKANRMELEYSYD